MVNDFDVKDIVINKLCHWLISCFTFYIIGHTIRYTDNFTQSSFGFLSGDCKYLGITTIHCIDHDIRRVLPNQPDTFVQSIGYRDTLNRELDQYFLLYYYADTLSSYGRGIF